MRGFQSKKPHKNGILWQIQRERARGRNQLGGRVNVIGDKRKSPFRRPINEGGSRKRSPFAGRNLRKKVKRM